jgi:hypothetical protein
VTAEAGTMRYVREASLCSNPLYWPDDKSAFMMEQMGNAIVHCDIGNAKSGDENVHVAKRVRIQKPVDLPGLNDGNYYLHDDLNDLSILNNPCGIVRIIISKCCCKFEPHMCTHMIWILCKQSSMKWKT